MKIKKILKKVMLSTLIGCMTFSNIVYAQPTVQNAIRYQISQGGVVPYSMYLLSANIVCNRGNGAASIDVTTKAFTSVEHIYHDVTIYKNGVWVSSERYEDWGKNKLMTNISVSAQTGDYIEIYSDHYTDHLGYLEMTSTSKTFTY